MAAAEPPTEAVRMARKRFQEGIAAADAGNFEGARVAFQQAYALKPHASVLLNLGQAEVRTGHFLEAARHLANYLRDSSYGKPADRKVAQAALVDAESKVGKLVLEIDVDGAEATVDGELSGHSPTGADPFYVEAGQRKLHVKKDGYEDFEQQLALDAGRTTHFSVVLKRLAASRAAVQPAAQEAPHAVEPTPTPAATVVEEPNVPPPSAAEESRPSRQGVRPRTIVLVGGAVITGVALGVGVVSAIRGSSFGIQADDIRGSLKMYGATPCSDGGAHPQSCNDSYDRLEARNRANALATGMVHRGRIGGGGDRGDVLCLAAVG